MPGSDQDRRRVVGGSEQDALTGWRRWYCYTQRAGVTSKIKRQARRRERREAKADTSRRVDE